MSAAPQIIRSTRKVDALRTTMEQRLINKEGASFIVWQDRPGADLISQQRSASFLPSHPVLHINERVGAENIN